MYLLFFGRILLCIFIFKPISAAVIPNGTVNRSPYTYSFRSVDAPLAQYSHDELETAHLAVRQSHTKHSVDTPHYRIPVLKTSADEGDVENDTITHHLAELGMLTNLPHGAIQHGKNHLKKKSHAKPFSVLIDDQRYYGGLIKYSHDYHPSHICRVMNGCIRSDNTLVLSEWMQRYDNDLKFQCGHDRVEFSLPDTAPPPALERLDLIGLQCPRPSMSDFVQDFLPNAVIFDLIYGDYKIRKSCHSRKGNDCDGFPGLEEGLNPAVILHPRIRDLPKKSWVREFVTLMKPPHSGRQAKVLFEDAFRNESSDLTCFRSALFTRGPYSKDLIGADHLRRIHFLERHGIKRVARDVVAVKELEDGSKERVCELNVTISNRRLVDGAHNRLIGRYVMDISGIRNAIVKQARKIDGLRLKVAIMRLEGKTLRWQMNAMQKTDIWIAGHGSLLTNMLFLRENSSVIELQPFTFYPRLYERLAVRLAHVNYERYIADPDEKAFKACIEQMYDETDDARGDALVLLDRFIQAAKKFYRSDNTHSLVLHSLKDELKSVKTCAHMQRLRVNAANFAVAVVRHARIRCGFPKPSLKKGPRTRIRVGGMKQRETVDMNS